MIQPILVKKLRQLILFRLLIVAFFLTLGAILFEIRPLLYYGFLSGVLILTFLYTLWLAAERTLPFLTYFQISVDLLIVSLLVHYTGGVDSVLATLYVLLIVSAGFLLFPNAPLIVAVLSSVFFTGVVTLDYFHLFPSWLPPVEKPFQLYRDGLYSSYMTYVRVTIFMLVGFLSRYLALSVNRMERAITVNRKFSLLGEMAMHLAHEIKNPLMAISGSIELLKEDLAGALPPEDQKMMEAVIHESERLKDLFEKVKDYTRSEELEIRRIALKETLDEVFLLLKGSQENGHGVTMHLDYREAPECWILADRNRIKQVFMNIIYNALEAMPQGGDLTVHTHPKDFETEIVFKDSGIGMDHKTREELFIPFHSRKKDGTGIGLAIAYKIVRNHDGRIQVRSEPGKGSTFTVSLPRA